MDKDKSVPLIPDRPFDKLRLTELNNNPIDLKQFAGKTIFLNIWATWCKPCLAEMPSIQKAHNYQFKYTRIENIEEINIQGLPTTFIFDPRGQLVFAEMGSRKWDEKGNIDMILKIANRK